MVAVRFSRSFEVVVICIIIGSALFAGAKTLPFLKPFEAAFGVIDGIITGIFAAELLLRFIADKGDVKKFFSDPWNIFDTVIVMVSVMPMMHAELVVVGRLLRLFRILRLISIIPELRLLLSSFGKAIPQLGYVVLLLFIVFYIYAVMGATLFSEVNPFLWGDIANSMLTLFRVMTFEDWTDVLYEIQEMHWWAWLYFLSFIFFTAFAFLNMLIGVVVGVMDSEAKSQRGIADEQTAESQRVAMLGKIEVLAADMELIKQALEINGTTTHPPASRELEPDVAQKQRQQMLDGLRLLTRRIDELGK